MTVTYVDIALVIISIIIIVNECVNIHTSVRLNRVYDEYKNVRNELKSAEDKLSEVYERFEGESDVICRMVDSHRNLKRSYEKDHLLTMTMYNEYMNSKENWKNIIEYMEEKEDIDNEDSL